MQIVIDIPEELKNKIDTANEDNYKTYLWWFDTTLYCAIKNGTPLPKGHGRLIDSDALEYTCNSDECGMLTGCNHCQYNIITEDEIDHAPTIIEADKAESEGD